MNRWGGTLACLAACGRLGFDPSGAAGDDGGVGDGAQVSDGRTGDDAPQVIACADINLGSAVGANVASGSTAGRSNNYSACSGDGKDVTFGWFAPATGAYQIDLCGSEQGWDSVMSIRDGGCTGAQLACGDDGCGGAPGLQPRLTVNLVAGEGIVIIVDSQFPDGNYQLAITPL